VPPATPSFTASGMAYSSGSPLANSHRTSTMAVEPFGNPTVCTGRHSTTRTARNDRDLDANQRRPGSTPGSTRSSSFDIAPDPSARSAASLTRTTGASDAGADAASLGDGR